MTEAEKQLYNPWHRELRGEPRGLKQGEVACGYYRIHTRQGILPIIIWPDTGDIVYQIGSQEPAEADAEFAERYFSRAKAITEEVYHSVMKGGRWPDEVITPTARAAKLGDNAPPELITQTKLDELKEEFDAYLEGRALDNQEEADKVANFKNRFAELESEAEKIRVREKEPHLAAGRAVDQLWSPLRDAAKQAKGKARDAVEDFLKAERARKLAEAAEKAAKGETVADKDLRAKVGSGRGVTLHTITQLIIEDKEALFLSYLHDPRFIASKGVEHALRYLAEEDLKAGKVVSGARLHKEEKSR